MGGRTVRVIGAAVERNLGDIALWRYDYLVVNGNLDVALKDLRRFSDAERFAPTTLQQQRYEERSLAPDQWNKMARPDRSCFELVTLCE